MSTLNTAISNSSISLKSTQTPSLEPEPEPEPEPKKPNLPAWLLASPSDSLTSPNSRRICRICQMHQGEMVRPCDCAGTMGDVHEECLTKWVNMSNKQNCEICKSTYAKSGEQFKPIRQWSKPRIESGFVTHLLLVAVLIYLIVYVFSVMAERDFHQRVITESLPCRPDDSGRILLICIMSFAILNNLYSIATKMIRYLKRQRQIRFVNKHS